MLVRLARAADRRITEAVCVHPRTPPRVVYRLAIDMPEVFSHTELGRTLYRAGRGGAPRTGVLGRLLAREQLPLAWIDALLVHPHPSARMALAVRADLPTRALLRLVGDPSAQVRRVIAARDALEPVHVATLVGDPDARVRVQVAERASLAAQHVGALAIDTDEQVRRAIARRSDLPGDLAGALAEDASLWVRGALARNPACPEPLLLAFSAEHDAWIEDAVLANASAPPAALLAIAPRIAARESSAHWTDPMLVRHPRISEDIVAAVFRAAPSAARARLVHQARCLSLTTMLELAADPHAPVAFALSFRAELPEAVLLRLFAHSVPLVRGGAVRHAGAPASLIERGASDPGDWVRSCVAENPCTPPAVLARLSRDPVPLVRASVAASTRDPALLEQLATDPSDQVIYKVAYNRHTPEALARRLRDHAAVRAINSYW